VNAWLNAHYLHLVAVAVGFLLRWGAAQFLVNANSQSRARAMAGGGGGGSNGGGARGGGGKWNKGRVVKFVCLFFHVVAGLMFAYGAYPLATWATGWGAGLGGWLSVIFGVATIAAGWHALHGLIGLVYDMSDGTPDKEAFSAAFMVPTTLPLGYAALVGLFTNPRGVATGAAVVAVSIVTAIYAHKILAKTNSAAGHYRAWMWLSWVICAAVGFVHIPALIYLNDIAGNWLPEWTAWLIRAGLVAAGVIFALVGLGDILRDWTPEKWSQLAAMYTIPVFTVLAVTVWQLSADAETGLRTVFGAMS
jgi:succinate dehydrogenase hydrophobic anchor subunit